MNAQGDGQSRRPVPWKWPVTLLALALSVVLAWAGWSYWQVRKEEPLQEGFSAIKAGNYQAGMARIMPFAQDGHTVAQMLLAEIYAHGYGVPVDDVRAAIWLRRIECACAVTGKKEFGTAIRFIEDDPKRAATWMDIAARAGHLEAQRILADPVVSKEKGLTVDPSVTDFWQAYFASEEGIAIGKSDR